jgi:flavodoxin
MRTLVVFYSFDGNTRFIARHMASAVGADLLELEPREENVPHTFMKYVWGGRQACMKEVPPLRPFDRDPQVYDRLIVGTPVWAFSYAPPVRTFLTTVKLTGKRIAIFCCHGGGKARTLQKLREALAGNEILGETDFMEPLRLRTEACAMRAEEWARALPP